MPFRDRLRKAFRSNSSSSSSKSPDEETPEARWPSNVYRPGEPMPRPKYRAPVKKEHKEHLEAFDFGSAWRRRSHHSTYSPMGSRLPSRRPSIDVQRKSFQRPSVSRQGSVASYDKPPRSSHRHEETIGGLSRISSELPTDARQTYTSHQFDSASTLQEASPPQKQDSGPPSQFTFDFVKDPSGKALWSEEDLVAAMRRQQVVA